MRQYVDQPTDEPTTLRIHPGADGEFSLYDDDGRSLSFEQGDYSRTRLTWDDDARTLTIEPEEGTPAMREFLVVLAGEQGERSVSYDGSPVSVTFD